MSLGEKMDNNEYLQITQKIFENRKFNKLKDEKHHDNSNRYNHCVEVSYKTYKICKKLGLDYEEATKAALLHDFFFDEDFRTKKQQMFMHSKVALQNAKKIVNLSPKGENIIASHMFPVGGKLPRNMESVIVDVVDDYVSLKEKLGGDYQSLKASLNFLSIMFISILFK